MLWRQDRDTLQPQAGLFIARQMSQSNVSKSPNVIFFFLPSILQCDENATFSNQGLYLSLPCCKEDFNSCPNLPANLPFQRSPKETFWVSTILCSTKLTQNGNLKPYLLSFCMYRIRQFPSDSNEYDFILFSVDLLALLNWKAHPDRVLDILGRLRQISGEEIVKVTVLTIFI